MANTSSLIQIGNDQAAQYFGEVFAWCGTQNLNGVAEVFIASYPAVIHFRDQPDLRLALSGLFSTPADTCNQSWNVRIGDRSGGNIPFWHWPEFFVTSAGGGFQFSLIDPDRCVMIDFKARRAVLVNAGNVRAHEFHIPLLRLAIALVEHRGGAVLHAGVISARALETGCDRSPAVAIVGKGGSGKSTLIAAAREKGFACLGDDFVELAPTGELRALFRTGRLTRTSPAYRQALDTQGTYDFLTDKTVHYVADQVPDPARLCVIVAPTILRPPTEFRAEQITNSPNQPKPNGPYMAQAMTRIETLAAAVPSSVGASYQRAEAVRRLTKTLSGVPGFRLQITPNLDVALSEIMTLLNDIVRSGPIHKTNNAGSPTLVQQKVQPGTHHVPDHTKLSKQQGNERKS